MKVPDKSHVAPVDWSLLCSNMKLHDYIFRVREDYALPNEFIVAVLGFAYPRFMKVEGMLVLADKYSAERHAEYLSQGLSEQESGAWFNLVNIDSYFDDNAPADLIRIFGGMVCAIWKMKLENEFLSGKFEVEVLEDNGEYFVQFYHAGAGWKKAGPSEPTNQS